MNMEKIICPLCDSKRIEIEQLDYGLQQFCVFCNDCGNSGKSSRVKEVAIHFFENSVFSERNTQLKERRERIATAVASGIMACPNSCDRDAKYVVADTLRITDALIKALDEERKP